MLLSPHPPPKEKEFGLDFVTPPKREKTWPDKGGHERKGEGNGAGKEDVTGRERERERERRRGGGGKVTVMLRTGKGLRKKETIMIRRRQELQVGKRCS